MRVFFAGVYDMRAEILLSSDTASDGGVGLVLTKYFAYIAEQQWRRSIRTDIQYLMGYLWTDYSAYFGENSPLQQNCTV